MKHAMLILWPSFVVGAAANAMFFSVFDPVELRAYWSLLPLSRIGTYTLGFFAFWALGACSSALTCYLQRSAAEVNRLWCPLPNGQRPDGCRTRKGP
jgi:hypothetical protein